MPPVWHVSAAEPAYRVPIRASTSPRALAGRRVGGTAHGRRGVSITDTATASGLSFVHLSVVERGEQPPLPVTRATLAALAPPPGHC
jgi:hypothetical protein